MRPESDTHHRSPEPLPGGEFGSRAVENTSRSRKQHCAAELRRRILIEELEPGAFLDEVELAEAYKISRPPLREVLRELAGEGYVVLTENRAPQVTPMSHRSLHQFFIAAPMIYAAVSRLAAENTTPVQIEHLRTAQAVFRKAIADGDAAGCALANERFHSIIGEMAQNVYLMPSLRRLLIDHARIGMTFYNRRATHLSSQRHQAADDHDRFIALIEAGDSQGAADLAIAHWELSRSHIESFVAPQGLRLPLGTVTRDQPEEVAAS